MRRPQVLAKFCQRVYRIPMSTMNISLPGTLKSLVDEQVTMRGFGTNSEYVRELIRKDLDRQRLRELMMQGAESASESVADKAYFNGLRERAGRRKTA